MDVGRARLVLLLLVLLAASACGSLVQSGQPDIVGGHVVSVVESGNHAPQGSGMPQPFQRLRIQLDDSLYRGEVEELEWGGRRALVDR